MRETMSRVISSREAKQPPVWAAKRISLRFR
jgi:hypothetical protein